MNKPVLIGLNKVDIVKRDELKLDKVEQLKIFDDDNSLSMFELSTITQEGVIDFRNMVFYYNFVISLPYLYTLITYRKGNGCAMLAE